MKRIQTPPPLMAGFTLVETLIATFILAVGLLAAATMVSRSTIQDARAHYMSQATFMTEEFFERNIPAQFNATAFNDIQGTNENQTIDGVVYQMSCVVNDNTPLNSTRCKEVVCTVNWNNKGHQSQVVNTYVYARR